ncbi:O-antigen polymerase [Stanieria cyanosphaera PCC 7437]|uniref:O-antigen polymerase n=1 Tax=Stanieria cyanosphaera (strain ATCC 29371 / PCC 7437) TaxID=111780 RepID=K9XUR3_STAC7|nr:O-antigen ligase [Stanieria cyanosphaera]AFZ35407.1 O-antigen polymerase [Stanieria cyanosphaera PCC 7437]
MPELVRLGERVLIVSCLIYLTGTCYNLFPLPVISGIQYLLYGLVFLLVLARWQRTINTAINDPFIWLLLTLAVLSSLWSNVPGDTFSNSIVAWQTALVGVYLASCYTTKQQLKLLGIALIIVIIFNFIYTLLFPGLGIDSEVHIGAWQGAFDQKNFLAQIAVLSSLVFLFLCIIFRKYRYLTWTGLFLSFVMLLLSTSKTGLVVFLSIVGLLQFYRTLRWRNPRSILILTLIGLFIASVVVLLIGNAELIVTSLGKDITLSGRTELWNGVIDQIRQKPWLGYGRGGFWNSESNMSEIVGSYVAINFLVPDAHNGFLDLTADLGIVGLILFLCSFIFAFQRAFVYARLNFAPEALWHLTYLSCFFLYNLTESSVMKHNSIIWTVYMVVSLSLNRKDSQKKVPKFKSDFSYN